jgi:hypothetical protein
LSAVQARELLWEGVSAPSRHGEVAFGWGNPAFTTGLTASRCQRAGWRVHKQTCVGEIQQFWNKVEYARAARDWEGVLAWEGRVEEFLAAAGDDQRRAAILGEFAYAHSETLSFDKAAPFYLRKVDVLGACQRFRDQGLIRDHV